MQGRVEAGRYRGTSRPRMTDRCAIVATSLRHARSILARPEILGSRRGSHRSCNGVTRAYENPASW